MKKPVAQPNNEMTITEVGGLVIELVKTTSYLVEKVDAMDAEIKVLHTRIDQSEESIMAMTAKGFEAVDARFDEVDRRFELVDRRFEAVDRQFEAIDKRFEAVDEQFNDVNESIGKLRYDIWSLDERFVLKQSTL